MSKPCEECAIARESPHYTRFNPLCLWCGARLIQRIGALNRPRQELTERRRKVLADWVAMGHSEAEIRRLVAGPSAIEPDGTGRAAESGKRRS